MHSRFIASVVIVPASFLLCGCNQHSRTDAGGMAEVSIDSSSREVLVGETVTFVARSRDTYGRDAKLAWTSTAGKVTTEQSGRIARVKFDESGTYTVKVVLSVDGRDVQSDMTEVRVKPIN